MWFAGCRMRVGVTLCGMYSESKCYGLRGGEVCTDRLSLDLADPSFSLSPALCLFFRHHFIRQEDRSRSQGGQGHSRNSGRKCVTTNNESHRALLMLTCFLLSLHFPPPCPLIAWAPTRVVLVLSTARLSNLSFPRRKSPSADQVLRRGLEAQY